MSEPIVSIVTPTFNSAKYLWQTYQSIQKQTHDSWEWVVTDDCSTDHSWDMLQEISQSDPRVLVARNKSNSGSAISRNNSLDRTSGKFIAFLDADDLWFPKKLEKQISFMQEKIDFSFTAYEIIQENSTKTGRTVDSTFVGTVGYQDMLMKKATLGCSTVMLRQSIIEKIRMPNIRKGQDYAFWLSILRLGHKAHILNEVLTQYRITPNSVSRNKFLKSLAQWRIYRDFENISFAKSCWLFCHYARNAVFRKP